MKNLVCHPIAYFHSQQKEKYMAAKQSTLSFIPNGKIVMNEGCNYEQALKDLKGFERIWIIYWFHKNERWKTTVATPRGGKKRGVFATRSPHRPNPIGISCVELLDIKGRTLTIGTNDLLDGTPVLDIKPYIVYADAFNKSRQGWLEDSESEAYEIIFSSCANEQITFIEKHWDFPLKQTIEMRLKTHPYPLKNNRIKRRNDGSFALAMKTWRVSYRINDMTITIDDITSGYDMETLAGKKASRWDDVPLHQEFIKRQGSLKR